MSNLSELAMALRVRGLSVNQVAKALKVKPIQVSKVCAGKMKSEKIERELIRLGLDYLLQKVQTQTGIIDYERFDRLNEEVKKENGGK